MDLGVVAAAAARLGAAADARAAAERVALAVRLALPLVEARSGSFAAGAQLVRDLRAAAPGQLVTLLLPAGRAAETAAARLDTGRQQFPIPAALRDALLAAARTEAGRTGPAPPGADAALRAWVVGAQTTAAAALAAGASGIARTVSRDAATEEPRARVSFTRPLLQAVGPLLAVSAVAGRLREHLERSGLFYESHVAQWARGTRGEAALRQEVLAALGAGERGRDAAPSGERVAAQLEVLQRQGLVLQGPAWNGQPVTIEFARERAEGDAPAADPAGDSSVFRATVRLDLPRLGSVSIVLRMAGASVAAAITADHPDPWRAALADLAARFEAQDLRPVRLQADAAGAP